MIQAEFFKIEFPCDTDFCLVLAGNRNLAGVPRDSRPPLSSPRARVWAVGLSLLGYSRNPPGTARKPL
jgi:hypothetical protein